MTNLELLQARIQQAKEDLATAMNKQLYGDFKEQRLTFRQRISLKIFYLRHRLGEWIAGDYFTNY